MSASCAMVEGGLYEAKSLRYWTNKSWSVSTRPDLRFESNLTCQTWLQIPTEEELLCAPDFAGTAPTLFFSILTARCSTAGTRSTILPSAMQYATSWALKQVLRVYPFTAILMWEFYAPFCNAPDCGTVPLTTICRRSWPGCALRYSRTGNG